MIFIRYFLTFIIFYSVLIRSIAQNAEYNTIFDQGIQSRGFNQPAFVQNTNVLQASIGYNGFNRLSPNLRRFYSEVYYSLNKKSLKKARYIGFNAFQDDEGKIIHNRIFHAKYAQFVPFSERVNLVFGIALGDRHFENSVNDVTGGFSHHMIDGQAGMRVYSETWSLGIGVESLFARSFLFKGQQININRLYTLTAATKFPLGTFLELKSNFLLRISKNQFNVQYINELIIYDKVLAFQTLESKLGFVLGVGIKDLQFGKSAIKMTFSFRKDRVIGFESYEINLGFTLKSDKRVTYNE